MKRYILAILILSLLIVACGSTTDEPTADPAPTTLSLPTNTPEAATSPDSDGEGAGETAPTVAPVNTVAPTMTMVPPTEPPPTATPIPPTPTPAPTIPAETIIEVDGATLPPGFSMIKFADAVRPVAMTFDQDGYLWTTHQSGEIWVHRDGDGDGRAEIQTQVSFGFDWPNGIAIHPDNGDVYISQKGKITLLRDTDGDYVADEILPFIAGLPFGLHWGNHLVFGPDGWLYMGLGSTCDACVEVDERSATVMRFNTETAESEIVATGLRNAFDVAFHPETGALFATDNGRDLLGDTTPPEELNHIVKGFDYGWPDCWGQFEGTNCEGTQAGVGFFQAHSSTNSLEFYTASQFPEQYRGKLFASVFGSWFVPDIVDQGIREITLTQNGGTYAVEHDWFLRWDAFVLGLAVGPDGALYVGDYNVNDPNAGAIYRISYGLP